MPDNEYNQKRGKVCENMSTNHTSGQNHSLPDTSPQSAQAMDCSVFEI